MADIVRVPVVKVLERDLPAYVGKMKAIDLLEVCDIKRFSERTLEGFQREPQQERLRQIAKYVKECPIPVMPAILVSLGKEVRFVQADLDFGFLEIPRKAGAITLIDGQHRLLGFQLCKRELEELEFIGLTDRYDEEAMKLRSILNYEIPTLFIDTQIAAELVNKSKKSELKLRTLPEHVELMMFYIVNRTQKGIRPSLKDALQYVIWQAGIEGLPAVEEWRGKAAHIGILLERRNDSPLYGKINVSGAPRLGKPTQLASFVSSLEELFIHTDFGKADLKNQYEFLKAYWEAIRAIFPEAFGPNWRQYMILKAIGVYSLNMLAADVYRWLKAKGLQPAAKDILNFIKPLESFDWAKIRPYSGLKGVREAYKELLRHLARARILEAEERLKEIDKGKR